MEYLALTILILHLLLVVFYSIKLFNNNELPAHRKSFWFFEILTRSVFGWMHYRYTDGRTKFKKPL